MIGDLMTFGNNTLHDLRLDVISDDKESRVDMVFSKHVKNQWCGFGRTIIKAQK